MRPLVFAALVGFGPTLQAQEDAPPRISDNSFLVEEAYNQEPRVVQHIFGLQRATRGSLWDGDLTEEWPIRGQRHQLSYTIPIARTEANGRSRTALGDLRLNYRLQAAGSEGRPVWFAPRLSVSFPTGKVGTGHGAGGVGLDLGLPVSIAVARHITTHLNAAGFLYPGAPGRGDVGAPSRGLDLAASVVVELDRRFNIFVETVWETRREVTAVAATRAVEEWFVNPGIRWAHNFASGLQIVPGIAYTLGAGPSRGDDSVFLYLSFEYPFKR